jgi:hypothetical protein
MPFFWYSRAEAGTSMYWPFSDIQHLVALVVEGVGSADIAVVGNVFEVAAVLEPGACHRNVVGGAFAFGLDQHAHVLQFDRS